MLMYVGEEWQGSTREHEIRNPYSGALVDTVPVANAADVEIALAAAERGAAAMWKLTAHERFEVLVRAAELTEAAADELALTIGSEVGKPLTEARAEAARIPALIRLSAFEGARLQGETLPLDASAGAGRKLGFTLRQPCGVVVAITPFNYPALLVAHKLYPALAAGNAVILKPATATPLTALKLTAILLEAGLPSSAIQCITGSGAEVGLPLCSDPRVRKVSFTGSTDVGRRITQVAGIKRLSLELGANCAIVVLPDADVEQVAAATATGGYANAGQVCISVQRTLVHRRVYGDFLDALRAHVEKIRVGDPFDPNTQLAALIDETAARRVEGTVRDAVQQGATLVTGGDRTGAVIQPTIVADVDPTHPLSREELFGPAVAVTPVDDVAEAIELVNASAYGLGAGVFTADVDNALRFAREVDCGSIQINWTPLWRADLMPYGGLKGSGLGKEGPRYAVDEMTESKTVVFHPRETETDVG